MSSDDFGPVGSRRWCQEAPPGRVLAWWGAGRLEGKGIMPAWIVEAARRLQERRKRPSGGAGGDRRKGRKVPDDKAGADVKPSAGPEKDRR
jgi:hypothetical protein